MAELIDSDYTEPADANEPYPIVSDSDEDQDYEPPYAMLEDN